MLKSSSSRHTKSDSFYHDHYENSHYLYCAQNGIYLDRMGVESPFESDLLESKKIESMEQGEEVVGEHYLQE